MKRQISLFPCGRPMQEVVRLTQTVSAWNVTLSELYSIKLITEKSTRFHDKVTKSVETTQRKVTGSVVGQTCREFPAIYISQRLYTVLYVSVTGMPCGLCARVQR